MTWTAYFSISEYWSLSWALALFIIFGGCLFWLKPKPARSFAVFTAFLLLYLMLASPVAALTQFGLHSVAMLQHVVVLMLVPLLLWAGIPSKKGKSKTNLKPKKILVLLSWLAGTASMWAAHFLSAAKISARSGLSICGISAEANSWVLKIPDPAILLLLLLAGIVFLLPVYGRSRKLRLSPLGAVAYLFTACVSCSILGLWVAFSASSAGTAHAASFLTTLRNPFPMSLRADQELAGMIMWVPGCVLYVATSVHIALGWLEDEKQVAVVSEALPKSRKR
ncbi:MAG: cytochrome c oxidase assembly protein [Salinimicrobium sp.]